MNNKYRAWNKVGQYMEDVDGYDLFLADGKIYEVTEENRNWQTWMERTDVSDKYDLMQFTGLYDINKTEIYEGDVYKYDHPNYGYGDPNVPEYKIEVITSIMELYGDELIVFNLTHGEVIGNIYHDPELLIS